MLAPLLFVAFQAQWAATAASSDDQKCRLEGQVISASTGAPLKHASLYLQPMGPVNDGATRTVFTSSTDAEGKFVMQNVDPGTYVLIAQHAGFVQQQYGGRSANSGGTRLKLESGQSMKDLLFKLVPQAMIYGRVVDDDGQGVPSARIQVQRWAFFSGKKQLRPVGGGMSQADGSFVIALNAGRVYLNSEPILRMGEIEKAAGKTDDAFLTTYFPNALDLASAAPVELQAGVEMRGIEIHMRRGRMHEIRGRVENTTSGPLPDGLSLYLLRKGETFFDGRNGFYVQGKSGVFLFKNVLPGDYVIQTLGGATAITVDASGETRTMQLSGRVEVSVGDGDVENVVLPLGPGLDIAGTIAMEGGTPQQQTSQPPNYRVNFSNADGLMGYGFAQAQVSTEGNFRLHNVAPGAYRVNVNGTPDGSYVKAIRFGGEDITGKNLDLTSGAGGNLEIIVSPNAADVNGVVRNADGDAASGVLVQAFLGDEMKRSANTDQNGAFHFTSLAPGNYRVYAWEDVEPGLSEDPDFRKNFDGKAIEVKLEEKSHESVEVNLIPKDAIEAEAAKVQ